MKKKLFMGAFISYFTIGINIIAGLLYTPWMIHTIGNSQYALYTLTLSVIDIFMTDFGISSATSRFLSNYYANGEEENVNRFLGITLKLYLIIDVILFLVLYVLYFFLEQIYVKLTLEELHIFKGLYSVVAFYSIVLFPLMNLNGVLMAKEKFILVKLCGLFQKLLVVLGVICALMLGGDVYALVLVNAVSNIFFSAIKLLLVKREGVKFNIRYKNRAMLKELFTFSIWSTVVQFMQRFIFNLAPTLLATYVNSTEITYFSLASTIEGYVWIIGDAINGMFMPQVARLNREAEANEKIINLMCKVGQFQIFITGFIVVTFGMIGSDFVFLWMGEGYEKVAICGLLIIVPALLDIPQQIGKTTMLVRNKVKLEACVYILMILVYLPIATVLTKKYGVIGTAVAILISYTIRSVTLLILYQKKFNLSIKKFCITVYGRWTFSGILCATIVWTLLSGIEKTGIEGLVIKGIVCSVIYLIVIWFTFLNSSNRKDILSRFANR